MSDTMRRILLADLLDDAARVLRKGPDADAQALALHLVKHDGPVRSAWSKLAPMTCLMTDRPAARRLVDELTKEFDAGPS
jgi:hypothetical protein